MTTKRASEGRGRHRQAWITLRCPDCGLAVQARRTRPGKPMHVRAHLTDDGTLCVRQTVDEVVA